MRKSGCNRRKPRVRAKPRNGAISRFQRFLKMGASTADCIWQIVESIRELIIISHDEIAPVRSKGGSFSQPGHKLWVSRRTFLLMVQAFWLVRLTWHSRSHEIAIGYIEEMERQYTSSIAIGGFSRSIPANLWDTVVAIWSAGIPSENHFRTINVQWIGQWGLFSGCSSS